MERYSVGRPGKLRRRDARLVSADDWDAIVASGKPGYAGPPTVEPEPEPAPEAENEWEAIGAAHGTNTYWTTPEFRRAHSDKPPAPAPRRRPLPARQVGAQGSLRRPR